MTRPADTDAPLSLQALLDEVGWSQYDLANRLDVNRSTVAHWCAGARENPRVTAWLAGLAEALREAEAAWLEAHPLPEGWE